ncbi:MAG: SGNH/GDSL hydrolase family protein [Lachnospiraceae bacterium]|nr:SGNH/GDSL hydrolase family protein [Lachnospiraceae bacterium]
MVKKLLKLAFISLISASLLSCGRSSDGTGSKSTPSPKPSAGTSDSGNSQAPAASDSDTTAAAPDNSSDSAAGTIKTRDTVAAKTDFISDEEMTSIVSPWPSCDNAALAAVMKKAEKGEKVTIACIGGSITQGTITTGSSDAALGLERNCYANIFFDWWKSTFPNTEIVTVNAGIGATDSYLGVHRVEADVLSYNPDLVLIEFSVNDENDIYHKRTYENLVRKLLIRDNAPAAMLLFMAQSNGATAQNQHQLVGFNYKLPMVSYYALITSWLDNNRYTEKELSGDVTHPSVLGHAVVGEILWKYLNKVYASLDEYTSPYEVPASLVNKPLTKEIYINASLLSAKDITPDSIEGFELTNNLSPWSDSWETNTDGSITFTAEFRNLGLLYRKYVNVNPGKYDVYIDGEFIKSLDSDFKGGWGSYAYSEEVFTSDKSTSHTVEIRKNPDSAGADFAVNRLMISK